MRRVLRGQALAVLATLAVATGLSAPARAEIIQLGASPAVEYFHAGVLVRPASFNVNEFLSTVAGTVTLSIQRIEWGDLLTQLSTTVALLGRADLQLNGNAVSTFNVTAGESFATSITARVGSLTGYSAYRLDVLFLPSATQVPLPAAGWLLLSGLGVLVVVSRRRRDSSSGRVI